MIEIARILCPVDFSECSRWAHDHAIAIARWYGSSIAALHVHVARHDSGPRRALVPESASRGSDRKRT